MKTHHFTKVVDSNGMVMLSGLPTHKEVEIVVIDKKQSNFQMLMKQWMHDIRQRHPFANMSKEEIMKHLRQTREEVYDELYGDRYGD